MSNELLKLTPHLRTFVTHLSHDRGHPGGSNAGAHTTHMYSHFKLVTNLSPLGALQVRSVPTAQSPQITDLKFSMYNACHVYYLSRKKYVCGSPKIGWIGRIWEVADGCIRLVINVFDFLTPQFVVDLLYYL
jgi:hypothetical protein